MVSFLLCCDPWFVTPSIKLTYKVPACLITQLTIVTLICLVIISFFFIFSGKEANIYHVKNKENVDLAIKVYMTSIMPFKSRDKYVKGDFRMRHGYSNEKEYRNLLRINQSGLISAPKPLRLKGVVLLMTFVGKDGIPAPKLKDVCFHESDFIHDIRTLFQKCRLVHADLSEYNLLYLDGRVWMIDVSQVENLIFLLIGILQIYYLFIRVTWFRILFSREGALLVFT
ncbi:unnamed protein product [Schistosoma curassoni]|uniref:non-specific serine/threonine protein kinase n=1 Tax=Schistosoma curassoni TaxID=6186 RepID=A0A183JQ10_9TREM|nr:unnamed protein product [Schistosoma curassoni]